MGLGGLFDGSVVRYEGRKADTEGVFQFLNRAVGPLWEETRARTDAWYAEYPDPDGDLRSRFRSGEIGQHLAAWWELYIYIVFRRLGFDVEIHPAVPGTAKKPDFRVSDGELGMYIECAAMAGDDVVENPSGQAWLCECINRASNPDFMASVDFVEIGEGTPSVKEVVKPIERWLATLDYQLLSSVFDQDGDVAQETFVFRDWVVRIRALPVNEAGRGRARDLIAIYPSSGVRAIDEVGKIRTILRKKGSRYGSLGAPLEEPLIVALLSWSNFADERDVTNALYGSVAVSYLPHDLSSAQAVRQRDGYWRPPPSAVRGTRIAGVLFAGSELKPWRVDETLPVMWINPWTPTPVVNPLPMTIHVVDDDGNLVTTPAQTTPQELLGVLSPR